MRSRAADLVSKVAFVVGFGLMLYYAVFIQPDEIPGNISNEFRFAWIFIVFGVVASMFKRSDSDARRTHGFRLAAVGWGIATIGILLEDIPSFSHALFGVGGIILLVAIFRLIPTFK